MTFRRPTYTYRMRWNSVRSLSDHSNKRERRFTGPIGEVAFRGDHPFLDPHLLCVGLFIRHPMRFTLYEHGSDDHGELVESSVGWPVEVAGGGRAGRDMMCYDA